MSSRPRPRVLEQNILPNLFGDSIGPLCAERPVPRRQLADQLSHGLLLRCLPRSAGSAAGLLWPASLVFGGPIVLVLILAPGPGRLVIGTITLFAAVGFHLTFALTLAGRLKAAIRSGIYEELKIISALHDSNEIEPKTLKLTLSLERPRPDRLFVLPETVSMEVPVEQIEQWKQGYLPVLVHPHNERLLMVLGRPLRKHTPIAKPSLEPRREQVVAQLRERFADAEFDSSELEHRLSLALGAPDQRSLEAALEGRLPARPSLIERLRGRLEA